MAGCTAGLIIIFIIAYFYHNLGLFVVSVEPRLSHEGFMISSTEDFASPRVKLFSDALEDCNNISVNSIATDVDEHEGEHSLNIDNVTNNVDSAAWVMLITNGDMEVFAKQRNDGTPERIYNYSGYPLVENMGSKGQVNVISDSYKGYITDKDLENFRYLEKEGLYELATHPFEGEKTITKGTRLELKPGGVDKYTVVIWLEGDDPDCVDDIKQGTIGLGMTFTKVDKYEQD